MTTIDTIKHFRVFLDTHQWISTIGRATLGIPVKLNARSGGKPNGIPG
jgi:hypothetical protein